jgi:ABC-type oligopeptide transport system substrate-binding subunit
VVGVPAGERGRKLRQAMSLALDSREFTRVFLNGRGILAQSPLPPSIFGYDEDYVNPYRVPDLERARALMRAAGYAGGIDPETGRPLRLTFNGMSTATRVRLQYQFFIDAWKKLGLDVNLEATNYNQYRTTVRKGAYQVFMSGWAADYPDPENFLFLLWGPNANARVPGAVNAANFEDPRFDALFSEMKDIENGPRRMELIAEMRSIVERERPWIELFHQESYALYHHWIRGVKPAGITFASAKYIDIDPLDRAHMRDAWNEPITWPAYALAALGIAITVPGVITFFRERQ